MAKTRRRAKGEGSIYQRKDGRYVAEMTLENGKRKQFYGSTQKEALEKLRNAQREQEQGILATGPQQTVKQFLEYWLEDVHKIKIRPATYEVYRIILDNHLIPGLGYLKLQKLTTQQVQSLYAKKLKEGLSPKRVGEIHSVLHTALDHAKRIKLVATNVSADVEELPRQVEREMHPLTPEQAQILLQKIREHNLEALLTLALTTGMRKGEILALRWQDLDLENDALQIRHTVNYRGRDKFIVGEPKTEKSKRKIILPQLAVDALRRHRAIQLETRLQAGAAWEDNDLVFPNKLGRFIIPYTLSNHFFKVLEEAGLPRIRFHDLRHSAATLLLSMGIPAKVIQEILGHSNIGITMNKYSHVLLSMQQEAMEKMDSFFRQQW